MSCPNLHCPAHPHFARAIRAPSGELFVDPFLKRWIDTQLGPTEWRGVIELCVSARQDSGTEAADALATGHRERASQIIIEAGGSVVAAGTGWMIAAWGLRTGGSEDCRRALMAAAEIMEVLPDGAQCHLDARLRLLAKDGGAAPASPEIEWRPTPAANEAVPQWLAQAVLVTEPFRRVAGLEQGLLALSADSPARAAERTVLYALVSPRTSSAQCAAPCSMDLAQPCKTDGTLTRSHLRYLNQIDSLGDLKGVIVAAAVAGKTFSRSVLARMLDLAPERIDDALEHARLRGFFNPGRTGCRAHRARDRVYSFEDGALQRAAFSLVPQDARRRLHAKAMAELGRTDRQAVFRPEVQIAQHLSALHVQEARPDQLRRWLVKAAWQSIRQGETARAIRHLEDALETASNGRDGSQLNRTERLALQLLGVQTALAKGNGAPAFYDLFQRALKGHGGGDTGPEFGALWGMQSYHLVKGEVQAALTIGRLVMSRFASPPDAATGSTRHAILAHRMQGLAEMLNGNLSEALHHYDEVLALYDFERDAPLRFAFGADQAALALAHRSWTHVLTGDTEAADVDARRARQQADRVRHDYTSCHVLGVLGLAQLQAGRAGEAVLTTRAARAIAIEKGFSYWVAWSDVVLSAGERCSSAVEKIRKIEAAIKAYAAQDARQLLPAAYAMLAEAALDAGALAIAAAAIESGVAATRGGAVIHRPWLRLLEARLFRSTGAAECEAEALERAYCDATAFGARHQVRTCTLDAYRASAGQAQILWQRRYHAAQ